MIIKSLSNDVQYYKSKHESYMKKKGSANAKKPNLKQNKVTAAHYTVSYHAAVFGNHTKTLQNGRTQTHFIANNADELHKSIVI